MSTPDQRSPMLDSGGLISPLMVPRPSLTLSVVLPFVCLGFLSKQRRSPSHGPSGYGASPSPFARLGGAENLDPNVMQSPVGGMAKDDSSIAFNQLRRDMLAGTTSGSLYAVSLAAPDYRAASAPPAQVRVLLESHSDKVVGVAYPRDSSEVFATTAEDGTVRVWDVNTYTTISAAKCQTRITGAPLCLDFTGEVTFSGWEDGRIRAHEAETGEELWSIDNCHRGGTRRRP